MNSPVLEARGIHVAYMMIDRITKAVKGVDLTVPEGTMVGLAGSSGSGKSSLALALINLVRYPGRITQGECWFDGQDLLASSEQALRTIRGGRIGLVVQSPRAALNPMLSVGAQIVDVYRAHANVTKSRARHHAVDMLALVGINDPERRFDAYPHELSGGMAQRAVIAMALVCEPKLLIADEPTSGVDVTIQAQILDDLARSARETGSAVLLVTQSLGILANYCDRALVMNGGLLIESASTQAFFRRPLHPSSRALLAGETGFRRSEALSGGGSGEGGNGCPISDWCPWADALRCVTELPQMIEVEADHDVRCHYATKLESDEGFTFHRHTAVDQTTAQ